MLTELEKAYFAGLFDGEGYASIVKHKQKETHSFKYWVKLGINMTSITPLILLKEKYGGFISSRPARIHQNYPQHEWSISTLSSLIFINDIINYSIIKKDQLALILEFYQRCYEEVGNLKGRSKVPEHITSLREFYYQKIIELRKDRK